MLRQLPSDDRAGDPGDRWTARPDHDPTLHAPVARQRSRTQRGRAKADTTPGRVRRRGEMLVTSQLRSSKSAAMECRGGRNSLCLAEAEGVSGLTEHVQPDTRPSEA